MLRFHLYLCKLECFQIKINCTKLFDMLCSCTKRRDSDCSNLIHYFAKRQEGTDDPFYCTRQDIPMRYVK